MSNCSEWKAILECPKGTQVLVVRNCGREASLCKTPEFLGTAVQGIGKAPILSDSAGVHSSANHRGCRDRLTNTYVRQRSACRSPD